MVKKSIIRTESLYNEDKSHRFSLKKSWDNSKPSACIVMISPSTNADSVCLDMTSMYTINNAYRLGFGSIEILNLYSKLNSNPFGSCPENDERMVESFKKCDKIILAWGKGQTSKEVIFRIMEVLKLVEPYKEKAFEIADVTGKKGYHPLASSVRSGWKLSSFSFPESGASM